MGGEREGRPVLHRRRFRLTYGDCDPAGIVYYASYFRWMESLHTEWWFLRGVRLDRLTTEHGIAMFTRAATGEYLRPPGLFDLLEGTVGLGAIGDTSYRLLFGFTFPDVDLAATGSMTIVTADLDRRPVRVPAWAREHLLERTGAPS